MRKLTIGAAVATAMLALPAGALGTHVPSTAYTGTVSGGTVSADVSADGSQVTLSFNGVGPCVGLGIDGTTPITNSHTFAYANDDETKTFDGSFGSPGTISGTVEASVPCATGIQSWTASGAVSYPDAVIAGRGDDVYNKNAEGQLVKKRLRRGKTATFAFTVQNDGSVTESFNSSGCASAKGFKVRYFDGVNDVTSFFTNGNVFFSGQLAEGESKQVSLRIKAPRKGRRAKKLSCVIATELPGTNDVVEDVVAVEVKVKRKRKRR